jgi:NAD(P)-dependent dehydrogenase (short-subunit alcohol dehydrogenase family)
MNDKWKDIFDFTDRVAVVTGGTGVLCGELACTLAELGARVALLDLAPERIERWRERLERSSSKHVVVPCDVLDRSSVEKAAEQVASELGDLDFLINGAGGNHPSATTRDDLSFFDLPEEALRHVFDLNILGTVITCQVFGRRMAQREQGSILNFSSMNAFRPLTRIPAYSAAKAGVSNFTQWLAVHMAQNYSPRIRVNAVAPGFLLTEQNRFLLLDADGQLTPRATTILAHTPAGRFGKPEDVVGPVLWLLSPAAEFVTGVVLPIDGGFQAFGGV